jgi:hypothetical protein
VQPKIEVSASTTPELRQPLLPPVLTPEEIDVWRKQLQERLDELDVGLDS